MRSFTILAMLLAIAASSTKEAQAKTFGLSIGINKYSTLRSLKGAVADAEDIAGVLKGIGADVVLLIDDQANRKSIEDAWLAIVAQASAQDVIIFSYAGHGGQEPDKKPIDEIDGSDEAFLLGKFNSKSQSPGFKERIVDDDFYDWLRKASEKGIRVIVIADSCFSGGSFRSVGHPDSTRFTPPYGEEEGPTIAGMKADFESRDPATAAVEVALAHVYFFSAVDERKESPEVIIKGNRRGALSYGFARAISKARDGDGDGMLTGDEVQSFVTSAVLAYSEGRQIPDFKPTRLGPEPLIKSNPDLATAAWSAKVPLRLFVEGAAVTTGLRGVVQSGERGGADLVWSEASREVTKPDLGDTLAHDISASGLQGVADKWQSLGFVKDLMDGRTVDFSLSRGSDVYYESEIMSLTSDDLPAARYVSVINLASDGSITVLHPAKAVRAAPDKEMPWPVGTRFKIDQVKVTPPFGADHVLLISSSKPLAPLFGIEELTAATLPDTLTKSLAGADYEIGLAGIYTREGRRP